MSTATRTGTTGRQATGVPVGSDIGLLVARVIVGLVFMGHGVGKLFGWFNQPGLDGTAKFFSSVGYHPGHQMAILGGVVELVCGLLLVVGFLIPLAVAGIIGDMLNAAGVKFPHGFWSTNDGYEYHTILITMVLVIAIAGPGAYAIDRHREWFGNRVGGVVVAVGLGVISGIVLMIIRD